jgi:large subunit ribosomal protein L32
MGSLETLQATKQQLIMAVPKRKTSSAKRNKRRTKIKSEKPQLVNCQSTGEPHRYHRAHWYENKLYYKGKVILEK